MKRKGQSFQETVAGKLATYTEEHRWPSSRSHRNLTKNPPLCTRSSFPPSPLRWISGQPSAGHKKRLLHPHFSLLQRLLSAWTQPRYPGTRALMALRRHSSRQLKTKRPVPMGQRGVGAPCGPPEKSRQPCAHRPQRAHPEAALL